MNRLSTVSPEFVQRTKNFTDAELRTCARNACRKAASLMSVTPLQAEAVASFPNETTTCKGWSTALAEEAAKWDDLYLDKHDMDPSTGVEEFSRARFGTALVNLLSTSRDELYDCIYEACMVVENHDLVLTAALPPASR